MEGLGGRRGLVEIGRAELAVGDVGAAREFYVDVLGFLETERTRDRLYLRGTVSDHASFGSFILGDRIVSPSELDLGLSGMALERSGEVAATGAGAATLESPVRAVAWFANTPGALGMPIGAGEVVLSGSLAALVPICPGEHVRVRIDRIGEASVRFSGIEREARSGAEHAAR